MLTSLRFVQYDTSSSQQQPQQTTHSQSNNGFTHQQIPFKRYGGGSPSQSQQATATSAALLEQQNEEQLALLSSKLSTLKSVTIEIGKEVNEHNKVLDNMEIDFTSVSTALKGVTRKVGEVAERAVGGNWLCYTIAFGLFILLFFYYFVL